MKVPISLPKAKVKPSVSKWFGFFFWQVKRHICLKVTTAVMLAYFLLLVKDVTGWFLTDWVIDFISTDPCTRYYDYTEGRLVWNDKSLKLYILAWYFQYYAPLILKAASCVIVFAILALQSQLF